MKRIHDTEISEGLVKVVKVCYTVYSKKGDTDMKLYNVDVYNTKGLYWDAYLVRADEWEIMGVHEA